LFQSFGTSDTEIRLRDDELDARFDRSSSSGLNTALRDIPELQDRPTDEEQNTSSRSTIGRGTSDNGKASDIGRPEHNSSAGSIIPGRASYDWEVSDDGRSGSSSGYTIVGETTVDGTTIHPRTLLFIPEEFARMKRRPMVDSSG